jgi:dTDP-4-amino-4,6-dideoxygalactose transaminase
MTKTRTERIFLSPPHLGTEELNFVRQAFESNYIAPLGPMVDAFEREFAEYIGIKHCAAVSSGTAAMPWWNRKNKGISPQLNKSQIGFNGAPNRGISAALQQAG